MKRIFFLLSFVCGLTSLTMAQSAQYENVMAKNVALLDDSSSYNPQKLQELANTFERIAAAEKSQWLPFYYAGYCYVMTAFMERDNSKIDVIADRAALNAEQAAALSPNNDEINCVRSLIATSRISVDPPSRGMQYGTESAKLLAEANKINGENPRVYFLIGQSLYYTPEQFGGSKTKAKEMFQKALDKFGSFKPASNIAPHWGEYRTKQLLAELK